MNRAPIAAWRTLVAAGGAASASHAALARIPVRATLTAALDDSPLVRDGHFDALVRPVELGGVLAKGVAEAGSAVAVEETTDADEARGRSRRMAEAKYEARPRRPETRLPDESRQVERGAAGRRRPLPPRDAHVPRGHGSRRPDQARVTHAMTPATSTHDGAPGAQRHEVAAHGASTTARPLRVLGATHTAADAARTQVIVAPPEPTVSHLLGALDCVTPSAASPRGDSRPRAPLVPDTRNASVLDGVLGRIEARTTTGADAVPAAGSSRTSDIDRPSGTGARRGAAQSSSMSPESPQTNRLQRELVPSSAHVDAGSGGFRGLASRALRQSESATPAVASPAPRLVQEVRTISDLPLDALDASVADSVTRILQREARRHGIDLAGSGV